MWQKSFVKLLESSYQKLVAKNPRYSRRAFAKKIGVSSGTLSDVLKQKTRLTPERALEIMERLDLSMRDRSRMLVLLGKSEKIRQQLSSSKEYTVMENWLYRTVLFAFDIETVSMTPEILSEKLGIPQEKISTIVEHLLELKLLTQSDDGKITRTKVMWTVPDSFVESFAHNIYFQNLELAGKAVKKMPAAQRDFTTLTFAGNSRQLGEARKEISKFYEKMLALMEEPATDNVYQISVFLHPLLTKDLL